MDRQGEHCLLIAEAALAHDGSLGHAHAMIDAAARHGAGAIKFQLHIAEAESTLRESFRVSFSRQDTSRFDYWQRTAFSVEQWRGLIEHARKLGLLFVCSPFSVQATVLLDRLEVDVFKIASGEVEHTALLDAVALTGRATALSSGLTGWDALDAAVKRLRMGNAPLTVLQATSMYPTPPELVGLNVLAALGSRYASPYGLSDHSGTIYPALAAVTLGASMIEVHLTLSRHMSGPDVSSSLTPEELQVLADGIRFLEVACSHAIDKDALAGRLAATREVFGRSVVAARPLDRGHVLASGDLTCKKPGGGLPADLLATFDGRILARDLERDELLVHSDVLPDDTP